MEQPLGHSFFFLTSVICQIQSHYQSAYLQMILMFIGKSEIDLIASSFTNLVKWEKEWSMEFTPSKCKLLIVTNRVKPVQHCYKMHAIYLENIVQEKYLGVILHRKLSWKPHVSNIRDAALIFYVVRRTT